MVPFNDEMTRRAALARFALIAGGAATSTLLPTQLVHAAPPDGLNAQRREVFSGLINAFDGIGPINNSDRDLMSELTNRYMAGNDRYRAWVDALLDAVDGAPVGARFRAQGVTGRRRQLQRWSTATEPADALMYRARPSDLTGPKTLAARNEQGAAQIRQVLARIPKEALKPDRKTALLPNAPATRPGPPISDGKGPLGTPVRMRRYLYHSSYMLLASFFVEDPKNVVVEVIA